MANSVSGTPTTNLEIGNSIKQVTIPDQETYNRILNQMVIAFHGRRKGCETERKTEDYCRSLLKTCLTQFKPDGRVWKNAPGKNSTDWAEILAARLRVQGYDLHESKLIERKRSVKEVIREKFSKPEMPKTESREFSRSFTLSEQQMYDTFVDGIESQIQLTMTPIDKMYIKRLAFLHVLNERDIRDVELSKDLSDQIIKLTESLGISGKQRITKFEKDKMGTLDELTTTYKTTLDQHIEVERDWQIEELLLIAQAIHRGDLEEFIGMYWIKTLYGDKMKNPITSLDALDVFLKKAANV